MSMLILPAEAEEDKKLDGRHEIEEAMSTHFFIASLPSD